MPTLRSAFIPVFATLCVLSSPTAGQEPVASYGEPGSQSGEFLGARGIDIDGGGRVFIADRFRNRILRFDLDGEFVAQSPFFFPGSPSVSFDQVNDVAIAPGQLLYAANEDDAQIVILDFDFNIVDTFGSQCVDPSVPGVGCVDPDGAGPLEVGDGQFNQVTSVAYDPNDRIVAVDTSNHRIQVFDLDGDFILKFGSQGNGNGQFQTPVAAAVDNDGNIYVADNGNDRVQVFDSNGTFLRAFGGSCNISTGVGCLDPDGGGPLELGDGQFAAPTDVAVDYADNVYVADSGPNDRVQVFNANGDFVTKLVLPDDTANVRGVAVDGMARVHVTTGNAGGTPQGVPFVMGVYAVDSDGDSLPDLWEQAGIDLDLDGEVEFDLTNAGNDYRGVAMIADPNRKDIFVEVDYFDCTLAGGDCLFFDTHSHRPRDDALDLIVQAFNNAPVTPGNGINLWVQVDEAIPHQAICDFEDGCFDAVKATNFGTETERAGIGTIAAKRLAFRYNLWLHDKEAGNSSSGEAEGSAGQVGNDFIVSLGSWTGSVGTREAQAGTFMHELGHTMALGHGGGDNANCKPNYLSVMSYTFQTIGLQPPGQFDFSRTALPTSGSLVEDNLDETIGIQDGAFTTFYGPLRDVDGVDQGGDGNFNDDLPSAAGSGAIDWDFVSGADDNPANPTDINFLNIRGCGLDNNGVGSPDASPDDTLTGFIDWDIMQIGFQDSDFFEDGQHGEPETEIDKETADTIREQVWRAQIKELHEYTAKFICGIQHDPDSFRFAPGRYSTNVNIHNPNGDPVTFRKKLALALPPNEQLPGKIYPISLDTLRYDEALKVDCDDVRKNVFDGAFPADLIDGFLVVQSPKSLDVVGVYTTATLGQRNAPPAHSDIEIERVPERVVDLGGRQRPDLVIDERIDFRADCQGFGAVQKCDVEIAFGVRNIGDATAGPFNVQVVHKLDDSVLEDVPVNEELDPGEVANRSVGTQFGVFDQSPEAKTICIVADAPTDQVVEKVEDNNERCLTF